MCEGQLRGLAATASSFEEAGLNQIGLMDIFESAFVFLDRGRQRFHPDRSSAKLVDDGQRESCRSISSNPAVSTSSHASASWATVWVNASLRLDLGIVAHPFDKPVDDSRGSSGTTGNFMCSFWIRSGYRAPPPSVSRWSATPLENRTPGDGRGQIDLEGGRSEPRPWWWPRST